MLQKGENISTDAGSVLTVQNAIGMGGEGVTYLVQTNTGDEGIMKLFHSQFATDATRDRIRFLVEQDLSAKSLTLMGPTEAITTASHVGHFAEKAQGRRLQEFWDDHELSFSDRLFLAGDIAFSVATLHAQGISHGDINSANFMVTRNGVNFKVAGFDFDTFNHAAVPDPGMLGHQLNRAPELRQAVKKNEAVAPTIESDLFSLACVLHEVVLGKNVFAGFDETQKQFEETMTSGKWHHDPELNITAQNDTGGLSAVILSTDLMQLFRRAVSLVPTERPSAQEWVEALTLPIPSLAVVD